MFRSEIKHGATTIITESCVIEALGDDNKVFENISGPVWRSFPLRERLTPKAQETLYQVLEDGYIEFDESVDGIRFCYENGWIHRVVQEIGGQLHNIGILQTRLHEK
jgi:hypothetical protein